MQPIAIVLQAACRERPQKLVLVLARGEDAGVSGPGRRSLSTKPSLCWGPGFRTRGDAPSCSWLAGVVGGFHPATAAVLCLR